MNFAEMFEQLNDEIHISDNSRGDDYYSESTDDLEEAIILRKTRLGFK